MAAEAVERLARRLSLVGGTPELPEDWQHGNPIASFLETLEGAVEERLNRMEELERTCGEARLRQVNLGMCNAMMTRLINLHRANAKEYPA